MNNHAEDFLAVLHGELIPAFGCTEPIALAYAAAIAREVLGAMPERLVVGCSGNIVKNVKGVIVPGTGGLRGIEAASLIGMAGGDAYCGLEVLGGVTAAHQAQARAHLQKGACQVKLLSSDHRLHITVEAFAGQDVALVEIVNAHTNVVRAEKNGIPIPRFIAKGEVEQEAQALDLGFMSFERIVDFARQVDICRVAELLDRQIEYNTKIAERGLEHPYGANVGATLIEVYGSDIKVRAKALPAAGSDARMGGCEMPVVINSGSGNQGMTVSLPVIAYAGELGASRESLYRALVISNLTAIYQKKEIGRLSAYCGAVSAAAGAGAGIAYLMGGDTPQIASVVSNTLANVAGIICDGAKASCAAKIASSVEAAIMAVNLTFRCRSFQAGEGLVNADADITVRDVGLVAREGMGKTDEVILRVMING